MGRRTTTPRRLTALGTALKEVRHQKGVRLAELSKELEVSVPYLSDVENGRRLLSDNRIRTAAKYLGVDPLPLLELATKDRGKITIDTTNLSDRQIHAVMLMVSRF